MSLSRSGLLFESQPGSRTLLHGVRVSHGGAAKPAPLCVRTKEFKVAMLKCFGACDIRNSIINPRLGDGIRASVQTDEYGRSWHSADSSHVENVVIYHSATGLQAGTMHLRTTYSYTCGHAYDPCTNPCATCAPHYLPTLPPPECSWAAARWCST